jgi:predicted transcriptional regulator
MSNQDPVVDPSITTRLTADVVAAYVKYNAVPVADLARLIRNVHSALSCKVAVIPLAAIMDKQKPAVSVRKSLQPSFLTCLECGNSFKSLKRHLMTYHAMKPDEYRVKWDLPRDYPMVAPNYAETRSALAKQMRLGQTKRRRRLLKTTV